MTRIIYIVGSDQSGSTIFGNVLGQPKGLFFDGKNKFVDLKEFLDIVKK